MSGLVRPGFDRSDLLPQCKDLHLRDVAEAAARFRSAPPHDEIFRLLDGQPWPGIESRPAVWYDLLKHDDIAAVIEVLLLERERLAMSAAPVCAGLTCDVGGA